MASVTRPPELNRGILTSWLPVSTWPTNPECSAGIYSQQGSAGVAVAFDPLYNTWIDNALTCLPQAATVWWLQQGENPNPATTRSMGPFNCGGDYTTASTSKVDDQTTFVACCPSNYDFQSVTDIGKLGQCNSPLTSGQAFTFISIIDVQALNFTKATVTMQSKASVYAIHVNGYIFADPTTSSTASLTSSTSSSSSTPTTTPSPSATPTPATTGLSSPAKIGLGIGVGAGGLLIFILAMFFFRRHRRRLAQPAYSPATSDPHYTGGPAMAYGAGLKDPFRGVSAHGDYAPVKDAQQPSWLGQRREIALGDRHEAAVGTPVYELSNEQERAEMDGGRRGV